MFYHKKLYIIFTVVGFFLSLFGALLVLSRNQRIRKKLRKASAAIFRKSVLYYIIGSIGVVTKRYHVLMSAFLLSLLMHLSALAGVLICVNIVAEELPNLVALMAVSSVVFLLGVIPVTPGNIGWMELLAAYGWSSVGSNSGAEIFLYWRIITVLCSLSGGLLYLLSPKNKEHGQTAQSVAVDVKTPVT